MKSEPDLRALLRKLLRNRQLVLTLLISMFLTALLGMLVERVGYRPLRDAPRASAAITGLMIGIILETVAPFLGQIQDELTQRTYVPLPARKKEIPKDGGHKVRVLSIPTVNA